MSDRGPSEVGEGQAGKDTPYREALICKLFGHKYVDWIDIRKPGEHPRMVMQYRHCRRRGPGPLGLCMGSDLRFKPWPKEPK